MSGEKSPPAANAHGLQQQAVKWVVDRHISEGWGEDEQNRLDAWLDKSPAHLAAYWCAEDSWNRTDLLSALRPARSTQHQRHGTLWSRWARRVAVLAAIVAIGTAGSAYFSKPSDKTYSTDLGGRQTLSLADGSQVELNTNTVLRIGMSGNGRIVTLKSGEAFFQIKHDNAHPFVVRVGNHRIVDVGTKFSVRTEAGQLRVALMEGAARLEGVGTGGERVTLLKPGDIAIATAGTVALLKATPLELTNELAWRRGVLVFDNTTLGDVAAEFNRYNNKKIIIASDNVGRMRIMGSFQANDLHAVIGMAREMFHLRVVENSNEIVISR